MLTKIAPKHLPITHFGLFNNYFSLIDQINKQEIPPKIFAFFLNLTIKCALLIAIFVNDYNEFTKVLLFDYFYIFEVPRNFIVFVASIFLQTGYFYYAIYIQAAKNILSQNPKAILLGSKSDLFLEKYLCGRKICSQIQRVTLLLLNLVKPLPFAIGIFFLYIQLLFVPYLIKYFHYLTNSIVGFLSFLVIEFNVFTVFYYLHEVMQIFIITFILMLISTCISFIQMKQAVNLVKYCIIQTTRKVRRPQNQAGMFFTQNRHIIKVLNEFYTFHTKCVLSIIELNVLFGNILLKAVLFNTPVSAFLIQSLLSGQVSQTQMFFLVFVIFAELVYIFGMHFMAILYSSKIHKCSKYLITFNVINMRRETVEIPSALENGKKKRNVETEKKSQNTLLAALKIHLKLDNYIWKFHTQKRLGKATNIVIMSINCFVVHLFRNYLWSSEFSFISFV